MEDKKRKRTTLILLALLALLIGLLIPFTWRSFKAVKASLVQESSLASKASETNPKTISGGSLHGGWIPSSTPTNRPTATSTATAPPLPTSTATHSTSSPQAPASTATYTATLTLLPEATSTSSASPQTVVSTASQPLLEAETPSVQAPVIAPTVGPAGNPRDYSTLGITFGLIAVAAFFLYFSGTVMSKRKHL